MSKISPIQSIKQGPTGYVDVFNTFMKRKKPWKNKKKPRAVQDTVEIMGVVGDENESTHKV